MKKIFFICGAILLAVVFLIILYFFNNDKKNIIISEENISAYLLENGWETDISEFTSETVTIPYEFSRIYSDYNEIQKQQGFDLQKHKGETAVLITCPVTNYDSDDTVSAELIISNTYLIGADIYCTGENGFIKPINKH